MTEFILRHELWIAIAVLILSAGAAACTAQYKLHPGALNVADSAVYDTLLVAEAAIDQAREQNQTQPFSAEAKDSLNRLIQAYNVAREAWLTYRGAVATNVSAEQYFEELNRNLADLARAIEGLKEKRAVIDRAYSEEQVKR